MKKLVVLIFAFVLLVFAAIGSQNRVSAKEASPTVPFKATYQTFPVGGPPVDGYLILEIPGVGNGTHLGKSEWYADSIVDFNNPPPPVPQSGDMFFTAANGAKLMGTFAGYAVPNDMDAFDYWGEYVITEGTGRFIGATGNGIYYGGCGDTCVLTFEGTLTRP